MQLHVRASVRQYGIRLPISLPLFLSLPLRPEIDSPQKVARSLSNSPDDSQSEEDSRFSLRLSRWSPAESGGNFQVEMLMG